MARRRYRDRGPSGFDVAVSLTGLYLLCMLCLYISDRTLFWQVFAFLLIFMVLVFVGVFELKKFLSRRKRRRLDNLIDFLKQNGLEGDVNSFIDSYGLGKKTGELWKYDRYSFSQKDMERFRNILHEKGVRLSMEKWDDFYFVLSYYIDEKADRYMRDTVGIAPRQFTDLSGPEFESLLQRLFEAMGYSVMPTGRTGDLGCDLVVNMGNDRVVVQAKRYSKSVGPDAVREANTAMPSYNCNKAWVVASSDFTKEAYELARSCNVELIDKVKLSGWLSQYFHQNWR